MRKKVLIIDDDATIRFLLEKLLEKEYEVISTQDGQTALNWLNSGNKPDLILLDFEMPNINGNDIIRRVRFTPGLRKTPIIVLSGNDNDDVKCNFIKLGANDYLLKPFKESEFKEKIYKIMK